MNDPNNAPYELLQAQVSHDFKRIRRRTMKPLIIFGAILCAGAILLLGFLAASCDNYILGMLTGISLCYLPWWVKKQKYIKNYGLKQRN